MRGPIRLETGEERLDSGLVWHLVELLSFV